MTPSLYWSQWGFFCTTILPCRSAFQLGFFSSSKSIQKRGWLMGTHAATVLVMFPDGNWRYDYTDSHYGKSGDQTILTTKIWLGLVRLNWEHGMNFYKSINSSHNKTGQINLQGNKITSELHRKSRRFLICLLLLINEKKLTKLLNYRSNQ